MSASRESPVVAALPIVMAVVMAVVMVALMVAHELAEQSGVSARRAPRAGTPEAF